MLRYDDDGKYYLVTPVEKIGITVDDAPFVAVAANIFGEGADQTITFRTNVDDEIVADKGHPIRVETDPGTLEPAPYVMVRDGLEALIARSVFYQLVEIGVEHEVDGEAHLGVWSSGEYFDLGALAGAEPAA